MTQETNIKGMPKVRRQSIEDVSRVISYETTPEPPLREEGQAFDEAEDDDLWVSLIALLDKAGVPTSEPIEGRKCSRFLTTKLRVERLIAENESLKASLRTFVKLAGEEKG